MKFCIQAIRMHTKIYLPGKVFINNICLKSTMAHRNWTLISTYAKLHSTNLSVIQKPDSFLFHVKMIVVFIT